MKNLAWFSLVILFSLVPVSGQTIKQQVVSAGATHSIGAGMSLSGTLGQSVISTVKTANSIQETILQQGFWYWRYNNSIIEQQQNVRSVFSATDLNVSPHPVKGASTVHVNMIQAGDIRLELFSLLGEKVKTVYEGYANEGVLKLLLPADDIASGQYTLTMYSNGSRQSIMLVIIK